MWAGSGKVSASLSPGTEILTVQAADNDDPKTDNVRIFYRLVGQIPESPRALFRVDRDSGVISVQADSMEGTAPQYTLTITAEDAKGDYGSMHNNIQPHDVFVPFTTSLNLSNALDVTLHLNIYVAVFPASCWQDHNIRDKQGLFFLLIFQE